MNIVIVSRPVVGLET